ncbi:MAG: hypothetical protein A2749_00925 [Parcubacteria group bacterium RIFCSPHIGHO2_01_FULL_45_26]|nr:MAG: hypothetical protein A2749_00925 [Parcubacteria group bacterium RIFCSPHIGHO2_01_FULL_45_26]
MKYYIFAGIVLFAGLQMRAAEVDISFPVVELGGCDTKEACFQYCESPEHIEACVSFAEKNGLMSKEDVSRARSFGKIVMSTGGPGACNSPASCEAYCADMSHLDECINFAEMHGHKGKEVEEGRKIQAYLKQGGQMPGNCSSKDGCETYCSSLEHMEECILFAEKANIVMEDGHTGENLSPEKLRLVMTLMREGKTPGGCTSKETCESYCMGGQHFEECIGFGEQMGFISPEEATMARKTGGKGPGDCQSREVCDVFCNNPINQEVCFEFASEHRLMSVEELGRIKEGASSIRQGLSEASPEVKTCIERVLGPEATEQALSGNFMPGPSLGEKMSQCFRENQFPPDSQSGNHEDTEDGQVKFSAPSADDLLRRLPPEVAECVKIKTGGTEIDVNSMETSVKECFGQTQTIVPNQGDMMRTDIVPSNVLPQGEPANESGVNAPEPYEEEYRQQYEQQYQEYREISPSEPTSYLSPLDYLVATIFGVFIGNPYSLFGQ